MNYNNKPLLYDLFYILLLGVIIIGGTATLFYLSVLLFKMVGL